VPEQSLVPLGERVIDFEGAQALWDDPDLVEIPAKVTDEPRFLVIGIIGDTHWSAVITYRSDSIRPISVQAFQERGGSHL
jgi:uncharacterized DUF497 family protein